MLGAVCILNKCQFLLFPFPLRNFECKINLANVSKANTECYQRIKWILL